MEVVMPGKTVRLGYIGAGRFSQSRLLPNFKKIPDVELVAVSNSSEESSQRVADAFGFTRVVKDWRDIIADPDIDAVVVGTRTAMHPEMCIPALEAGKHVLSLNAIAPTLEGARAMLQKANEKSDLVTLVFPGQFYLREDAMMRWLLEEGYVGRVLHVFDYWYTRFFGLGSQFEVAHRWFGRHTRVFGFRKGFAVESPGTDHHGRAVRPESNVVVAELENGAMITYLHSTIAGETASTRFEVYGDKGVVVCYPAAQSKEGFFGARAGEKALQPLRVPAHLQESWDDPQGVPVEADFIAAICGEKDPSPAIPRFIDGVRLLEFTQAWRRSTETGGWCDVPNL
jgi:predicted dehydrogenase